MLIQANKMTMLLYREKIKNETHLQPLRENARKLAFLNDATKSNDGISYPDLADDSTSTIRDYRLFNGSITYIDLVVTYITIVTHECETRQCG